MSLTLGDGRQTVSAPVGDGDYSTDDYRLAPGSGPLAAQWKDKPHRLVYDLCSEVERRHVAEERVIEAFGRLRDNDNRSVADAVKLLAAFLRVCPDCGNDNDSEHYARWECVMSDKTQSLHTSWFLVYGEIPPANLNIVSRQGQPVVECAPGTFPVRMGVDVIAEGAARPWTIIAETVFARLGAWVCTRNEGTTVIGDWTDKDGNVWIVAVDLMSEGTDVEVRVASDDTEPAMSRSRLTSDLFNIDTVAFELIEDIRRARAEIPKNQRRQRRDDLPAGHDGNPNDLDYWTQDESASIKRMWREGSPALRSRLHEAFPVECDEAAEQDEALDKASETALDNAMRAAFAHGGDTNKYRDLPFDALKRFRGTAALQGLSARERFADYVSIFASVDPKLAEEFRMDVRIAHQRNLLLTPGVLPSSTVRP